MMRVRPQPVSLGWHPPGSARRANTMAFLRAFFLILLLAAGSFFVCFLVTGQSSYKDYGLRLLRWTLIAAFVFFGVLVLDRVG